jgi:putative oxidoreductase
MKTRKQDWGYLIIRLALGLIFIAHGSQKLFGWFGGGGVSGTAEFIGGMGLRPVILWTWLLIASEFFGGIAIVTGLLTRLAALGIIIAQLVAVVTVHGKFGFFLPRGFEFNLILIATALALLVAGAGKISLDWLLRRTRRAV